MIPQLDAVAQALHTRRPAAGFFHAGNRRQAPSTGRRKQPRLAPPRFPGTPAIMETARSHRMPDVLKLPEATDVAAELYGARVRSVSTGGSAASTPSASGTLRFRRKRRRARPS